MSYPITTLAPVAVPVEIAGRTFQVKPFTFNDLAKIQAWLDRNFSPIDQLLSRLERLPEAIQDKLLDRLDSVASVPAPRLGTPEADKALYSLDGFRQIFQIMVQAADPGCSDADVDTLVGSMSVSEFQKLMERLSAIAFEAGDPKAEGGAA